MANSIGLAAVLEILALLNTSPPAGVPQTSLERTEKVEAADCPCSTLYLGPEIPAKHEPDSPIYDWTALLVFEVSVAGTSIARPSEVLDPILNWHVSKLGGFVPANCISLKLSDNPKGGVKRVVVQAERPYMRATMEYELRYTTKVDNREVRA